MFWYRYRAKTLHGEIISGSLEAEDADRAYEAVREQGLFVVKIRKLQERTITRPLSSGSLAEYAGQMAVMLESGTPLLRAFNILSQKARDAKSSGIYKNMYILLLQGYTLSETMKMQGGVFPPLSVNMVKAGECGGELSEVMRELNCYYEKQHIMKQRIVSTLVYPVFLLAVMAGVMLLMFTVILPNFYTLFETMEIMPSSAKFLMRISDYIVSHQVVLILELSFVILLAIHLSGRKRVRCLMGKVLLGFPITRKLMTSVYTSRFARTLSTLYVHGVPMTQALHLSIDVIGNAFVEKQLLEVLQDIRVGKPLSAGIARVDGLDKRLAANIFVGEETGGLHALLLDMAARFDLDTEEAAKRFTALIEPVMIVILGVAAGAMLLTLMLPLLQYYKSI